MITADYLKDIVLEAIEGKDIFVVSVDIRLGNKVDISLDSMGYVNIDQCVEVNKFLRNKLGEAADEFEITVGSAGMDRPFKVMNQYLKNLNREVKVLTKDGREFKGILKKADENEIHLQLEKPTKNKSKKIFETESISLNFDEIKETKRIFTF
jgi:ribosome maturation factor RimP